MELIFITVIILFAFLLIYGAVTYETKVYDALREPKELRDLDLTLLTGELHPKGKR